MTHKENDSTLSTDNNNTVQTQHCTSFTDPSRSQTLQGCLTIVKNRGYLILPEVTRKIT